MSAAPEDDDDFLYGDEEAPEPKKLKQDVEPSAEQSQADDEGSMEDDSGAKSAELQAESKAGADGEQEDEEAEEEDGEYDEDDDSDIEFVIDSKSSGAPKAPAYEEPQAQPKEVVVAPGAQAAQQAGLGQQQQQLVPTEAKERPAGLDINAVAQYKGAPITQVELEELEDKPWRKPGADITDYFNFGFDEFTWTAYCSKQDNLRDTYTPQKLMSQMMGGMMFPPEMMQGMPPPNMMQMFPGMGGDAPAGMPPMPIMGAPPGQDQHDKVADGADPGRDSGDDRRGDYSDRDRDRGSRDYRSYRDRDSRDREPRRDGRDRGDVRERDYHHDRDRDRAPRDRGEPKRDSRDNRDNQRRRK